MKQAEVCRSAVSIMRNHARAVVHMRGQYDEPKRRLGLLIGAGVSRGLGLPDWRTLVERLATHPDIDCPHLIPWRLQRGRTKNKAATSNHSLASITQILFSTYSKKQIITNKLELPIRLIEERKINTGWMKLIHSVLYEGLTESKYRKLIVKHEYIDEIVSMAKQTDMVVNFNFDDSIEWALFEVRDKDEQMRSRGYETVWEPDAQLKRDKAVIYHPNGMLPFIFEDGASPYLIFSDETFQDQVTNIAHGKNIHLSGFIFRNTCLMIGLSLDDSSLKQILRQNTVSHPGHIHYHIHFVSKDSSLKPEDRKDIFLSNFEKFNTYTIFLTSRGIRELLQLISMPSSQFVRDFEGNGIKYIYYLMGAVGVGKSTSVKHFQSLQTYDEWVDRRKPLMAIPEGQIDSKEDITKIDVWIAEQFGKKNYCIAESREGVHIIDRTPLDPLTFGDKEKRKEKARRLLESLRQGGSAVQCGQIIWLDAGAEEIAHRKSRKHKNWEIDAIKDLLDQIEEIFGGTGAVKLSTHGRTSMEVAREIANIVHISKYNTVDIERELNTFAEGDTS